MANIKITDLTEASTLDGSEQMELVKGGNSRKTTTQAIANLFSLGYTPEDVANKSTDTELGDSDVLYPTQKAVKTYVDNTVGYIPPKQYVAFVTQESTDAPVVQYVIKNDFTGVITYEYQGSGGYKLVNSLTEFTTNKSFVSFTLGLNQTGTMGASFQLQKELVFSSRDSSGAATDGLMQGGTFLSITVFS